MKENKTYQPEWISAQAAAEWLGVDLVTLYRWRTSLKLNWTNINGKTVMYDKKQINDLLNERSTYKYQGLNLTA